MGKAKWNFSLILAIFLVGILNTVAFAATDPYNLKIVQNGSGLEVSFTGNSTGNPPDVAGKEFDLLLKDGSRVVNEYAPPTYPIVLDSNGKCMFPIPSSDLTTIDKVYTVELYYKSDTNHQNRLSVAYGMYTNDSHNNKMYQVPNDKVDLAGSGLTNSNHTGADVTRKAKTSDATKNQNVHGFYENNTNSCASCHQTHTGSDSNLLMKNGVYSTCSACHDGTTGAYNSFETTNETTPNSIAGTFDVSADTAHGSLHQADGSLKITSAPGGNNDQSSSIWNKNFDCSTCHAPHGGGSADENNLNVDPLGWGTVQYKSAAEGGTKDEQNGKLFKNIPVLDSVPTYSIDNPAPPHPYPYILVKSTITGADVKANYFYNRGIQPTPADGASVNIIQTYRWDGGQYVRDYSLWLQEKGFPFKADTALYNDVWSNLILTDANHNNDTSKDITRSSDVHVVWRDGFAWGPGVVNIKSAQVSLGIDVETTENVESLYNPNFTGTDTKGHPIAYIRDSGIEMTKYCTACHTDYSVDPATGTTGVLTGYHRHTETGVSGLTDSLTCVRCHYVHGTKQDIMKGDVSDEIDNLSDTNHSSALRRYKNNDSCYSSECHSKNPADSNYMEWSY